MSSSRTQRTGTYQIHNEDAPLCKCGIPAVEKPVLKTGPNHGRWFYSCALWRGQAQPGCGFFQWKSTGVTHQQAPQNQPSQPVASPSQYGTPSPLAGGSTQRSRFSASLPRTSPGELSSAYASPNAVRRLHFDQANGNEAPVHVSLELIDDTTFGAQFRYHEALKDYLKALSPPSKPRWRPELKMWTFQLSAYDRVLEALRGDSESGPPVPVVLSPIPETELSQARNAQTAPRGRTLNDADRVDAHRSPASQVEARFETLGQQLLQRLYGFQKEAVRFALERQGRVLLADEMGLGKTLQALSIAACYAEEWPLLVVCPAVMKLVWEEALRSWLPQHMQPASQDLVLVNDSKSAEDKLSLMSKGSSAKIVIISHDLAKRLLPLLQSRCKPGVIIVDESHHLKGLTTQRTLAIGNLVRAARRAILLSGTPALARPIELFPQIDMLRPGLLGTVDEFGMRYCEGQPASDYRFATTPSGMNYRGASCLRELRLKLEREVMVRRTKDQVLDELPEKIRKRVPIDIPEASHRTALQEVWDEMRMVEKAAEEGRMSQNDADNARQRLISELYRRSGVAKVKETVSHCRALLEAGHKLVLFAHHKAVLDALQGELFDDNLQIPDTTGNSSARKRKASAFGARGDDRQVPSWVRIDGTTSEANRKRAVDLFQSNDEVRAALLSINAAGVGITLTAGTVVVFAELSWTPGLMVQAEDRVHRMGLTQALTVHYMTAAGSADDLIWRSIRTKLDIVSTALGSAPGNGRRGSTAGDVFADMQVAGRYESAGQALAERQLEGVSDVAVDGGGGAAAADDDIQVIEDTLEGVKDGNGTDAVVQSQHSGGPRRGRRRQQASPTRRVCQSLSDAETEENVAATMAERVGLARMDGGEEEEDVDNAATSNACTRRRRRRRHCS